MANILSGREYAKNLLDFISRASRRRIEWRGDWMRRVDGETVVTRMDDHIGDLIEQYVQARIAADRGAMKARGYLRHGEDCDSEWGDEDPPCSCGLDEIRPAASVARGEEEGER